MFRTITSLVVVASLCLVAVPRTFGQKSRVVTAPVRGQADRRPEVVRRLPEGQGRRLPRAGPRRHQGGRRPAGRPALRREALPHGAVRPGADPGPGRRRGPPRRPRQGQGAAARRRHRQPRRPPRPSRRGPADQVSRGQGPRGRAGVGPVPGPDRHARGLQGPRRPPCPRPTRPTSWRSTRGSSAAPIRSGTQGQREQARGIYEAMTAEKAPPQVQAGAKRALETARNR